MAEKNSVKIHDTEKLSAALKFKNEGNECHRNRNFKQALGKYHRALLQLKAIGQSKSSGLGSFLPEEFMDEKGYSSDVTPEVQAQVIKLQIDCYNNLAACLLQLESPNYEKVINYCEFVLELDPGNAKACYRRGIGLFHCKKYEKALESLNQAASTSQGGKDPSIRKYIQLCKTELQKQEEELISTYKSMFMRSGMSGQENKA